MIHFSRLSNRSLTLPTFVQGIWVLENDALEDETQLVPDGHPEIVIPLKGNISFDINGQLYTVSRATVVGQITKPTKIIAHKNCKIVFIKLYPHAQGLLSKGSAKDLSNRCTAINDLDEHYFHLIDQFIDQLQVEYPIIDALNSLFAQFNRYLSKEVPAFVIMDQHLRYADVKAFSFEKSLVSTKYSRRYLEKIYERCIGISPKQFLKVLKVKKASIILSKYQDDQIKNISNALGYYDNSHLYKDFKSLLDISPKEYLQNQHPIQQNQLYLDQWDYS